jgi:genome maintenance exonuclease 1|tara:strand:+ start:72 stop:767 length:696 start_codon:yes stop_codon:yes gene_type:complete
MLFNHVSELDPIEMVAEMVEGKRMYRTPEGYKFPSVTTVISNNAAKKANIARWRKRVGEEKANAKTTRATGRGTKYHSIAEDYFNNNLDLKKYSKYPLPVLMFHHSRDTLDRINNIYLQEAALYSKHLELAGRVDCIAEFDGVLSIIDFKTAQEPKREQYLYDYFVQETAYACMLQEIYGLTVKQLVTIVACENGETQVVVHPPKKEYFIRLMSYIDEYQQRYGQKTIIRG